MSSRVPAHTASSVVSLSHTSVSYLNGSLHVAHCAYLVGLCLAIASRRLLNVGRQVREHAICKVSPLLRVVVILGKHACCKRYPLSVLSVQLFRQAQRCRMKQLLSCPEAHLHYNGQVAHVPHSVSHVPASHSCRAVSPNLPCTVRKTSEGLPLHPTQVFC